jgi:hypothetical protein
MKIYRFETPDGSGAFFAGAYVYDEPAIAAGIHPDPENELFHSTTTGFPGPAMDHELTANAARKGFEWHDGVFGFRSLRQARQWFPKPLLPTLNELGLTFTIWDVPAPFAAKSEHQAVFLKDHAKLVARLPVAALYERTKHGNDPRP